MTDDSRFSPASNGIAVDIGRPYYNPDNTVIQKGLNVFEFQGGFGTYQGGKNYAKAFGNRAFSQSVDDAEKSPKQALGLSKDEGLKIISPFMTLQLGIVEYKDDQVQFWFAGGYDPVRGWNEYTF